MIQTIHMNFIKICCIKMQHSNMLVFLQKFVNDFYRTKDFLFPSMTGSKTDNIYSLIKLFTIMRNQVLIRSCVRKQLSRGVLIKACSENKQQIYRNYPCWNVTSMRLLCKFTEIKLRQGCSHVNLSHIFRTTFLKNTLEGFF